MKSGEQVLLTHNTGTSLFLCIPDQMGRAVISTKSFGEISISDTAIQPITIQIFVLQIHSFVIRLKNHSMK